jgi:hypothetical protein
VWEESRGSAIEGWLGPETWGGGIDRSAGACMCSSSSARIRTVAPAETGFVLRRGQLNNSLGSGHCVFYLRLCERFA